jgi:putative transposase
VPEYRRWYVPGGTYFFTVVTHQRRPILTSPLARDCLKRAIEVVRATRPVEVPAIVLLPDHLHTIWSLPPGDADYSLRWKQIKELFTREFLDAGGLEGTVSASRGARKERGVWQRRFWEHLVRDEGDLKGCLDYIHWNPVKHGVAASPAEYPWSSFHRWVEAGDYPIDWGADAPPDLAGAEWDG